MTRRSSILTPAASLSLVVVLLVVLSSHSPVAEGTALQEQSRQLAQPSSQQAGRIITHPENVKALPTQNKRWALLIGVDKYEDSNISSLKGAANDARTLHESLIRSAGFPEDQVIVLSSDAPA